MEFTVNAGGKIEVPQLGEISKAMQDTVPGWVAEIARGVRFRRATANVICGAAGWAINTGLGLGQGDRLGPDEGFVWSVTHIVANGPGFVPVTNNFNVFVNDVAQATLQEQLVPNSKDWDPGVFPLNGGDQLHVTGTGTNGSQVTVNVRAIELPVHLAWQLL